MAEFIPESMPPAPGEDLPDKEKQAKINEKVAEMKKQGQAYASGTSPFKKQEGKAKKQDSTLAQFLIQCVHSTLLDSNLIEALNLSLRENHSPHLLIEGLALIYNITDVNNEISKELTLYEKNNIMSIPQWLQKLETASYQTPQRTLKSILTNPNSLSFFFEKVLQTYMNTYTPENITFDLVEMSKKITEILKNMIQKYIIEHSLE